MIKKNVNKMLNDKNKVEWKLLNSQNERSGS